MLNRNRSGRRLGAALGLLMLFAPLATAQAASRLVYISAYLAPSPPATADAAKELARLQANGIYAARLDTKTGKLTLLGRKTQLDRASWLVRHPTLPVIYSVADSGGGITTEALVASFASDPKSGDLKLINKVGSGGGDATHMTIDAPSKTLFVANHDTGQVTALPLMADGSVGPVVSSQKDVGSGPHPRQNRPQPHAVVIDPTHHYLLNNDFGADRIFVRPFNGASRTLSPALPTTQATPPGTGPRHFVFHPNGKFLFVNTEVGSTLISYRWDTAKASLTPIQTLDLYPADYAGTAVKSSSEIGVSPNGRFLYVSLRGDSDSIVSYVVDASTGRLTELQRISSGGRSPRSFFIDPTGRWMVVGNELTNTVKVFSMDPKSGKLAATAESISIPTPVAFTFVGR